MGASSAIVRSGNFFAFHVGYIFPTNIRINVSASTASFVPGTKVHNEAASVPSVKMLKGFVTERPLSKALGSEASSVVVLARFGVGASTIVNAGYTQKRGRVTKGPKEWLIVGSAVEGYIGCKRRKRCRVGEESLSVPSSQQVVAILFLPFSIHIYDKGQIQGPLRRMSTQLYSVCTMS